MRPPEIVFASKEMDTVIETAKKVASTSSPVLIEGESGTGKELIARLIHGLSRRKNRPFVAVNCGAVPETLFESEFFGYRAGAFTGALRDKPGMFEAAQGGTLFLDEIGDLSLGMQSKCLRAIQESELRRIGDTRVSTIDVRLVSATNKDLEHEMETGRFREDLFFRVSVLRIGVEPLRYRLDDIDVLSRHFAAKHASRLRKEPPEISDEVLQMFRQYPWPGNVRELENEIHRLVALSHDGTRITGLGVSSRIRRHACGPTRSGVEGVLKARLASYEKEIIKDALEKYGWNKAKAARYLGLTRQGLHRKVQRLRIQRYERG